MKWQPEWQALIEAHPERFIFAMENVFGGHWTRRYANHLKLWRKAFSLLPKETALALACKNAKRLWRLDVACRAQ